MPLNASDLGSRLTDPVSIVPSGRNSIVTTNKSKVVFTPAWLRRSTLTAPSTIVANNISTTQAGPNTATISLTITGALATAGVATQVLPRGVTVTVTHGSSIVACNGVVTGTDMYGAPITCTWAVTATGTSKTSVTAVAFKTITGITAIAATDASANSIVVGDSKVFGLGHKNDVIVPIGELEDGATPTAGVLVRASAAANADARGTYAPNSAPNGAKVFIFSYIVTDPATV